MKALTALEVCRFLLPRISSLLFIWILLALSQNQPWPSMLCHLLIVILPPLHLSFEHCNSILSAFFKTFSKESCNTSRSFSVTCKSVHSLSDLHPCGQYVTFKYFHSIWYLTWYLSLFTHSTLEAHLVLAEADWSFDWLVASILAAKKSVFVNIGHFIWWTCAMVQSSGPQDVVLEGQNTIHLGTLMKWISEATPKPAEPGT